MAIGGLTDGGWRVTGGFSGGRVRHVKEKLLVLKKKPALQPGCRGLGMPP